MLELYQFEQCPFSKKVREVLSDLSIDYIARNAPHNSYKRKLIKVLGGNDQVPFLVNIDKGIFMYGSDEIIQYLKENYSAK